MKPDITRKKLNKLLGKIVEYRATYVRKDYLGKRGLLVDVTQDGKLVTDHAWVDLSHSLSSFDPQTEIKFKATAYTYKDNGGQRKNGLTKCHNYRIYSEGEEQAKEDDKQRYLRCNR